MKNKNKKADLSKCRICGKKTGNTNVCDDCFEFKGRKEYHKFLYGN